MAVEKASPLEQFEIHRIIPIHFGRLDASFTNSALLMCIVVVLVTAFMVLSMRGARLVPSRWQSMAELSYEFVADMVRDSAGSDGVRYFPFVFTLFMFILFGNLIGLIPYSFTITSHVIVTAALALAVFIGVTIIAFIRHGFHFFTFFFPEGAPVFMAPTGQAPKFAPASALLSVMLKTLPDRTVLLTANRGSTPVDATWSSSRRWESGRMKSIS